MLRPRLGFACCLALALLSAADAFADDRPNVVVFLSDDQGWGDLSHSGNGDLSTPRIDSLAIEGASFDRFYVCPVCSPTRAEFLTGRYHPRSGVYSTSAGGERMDLDEVTVADLFQDAGYRTAAFGKWHNGMQFPYHPNARGFDEFYGFCSGHWGNYFSPMLERNGRIVTGEGFCIDDFTDHAISFVENAIDDDEPFFVYLPYNTPHSPMQVPDEYWQRFATKPLPFHRGDSFDSGTHTRCALAMCENLDWNVGRLLDALVERSVQDNTIVIWFHDNGPNGRRWNGGMKGRKGSTDEGGVRSPLFIRWPAGIAAGTVVTEICTARDLLPTLCDFAHISTEATKPLDGTSLRPLLDDTTDNPAAGWPRRILINHWKKRVSARSPKYRLDDRGQLYDMLADPEQSTPVTAEHPDVVAELGAVTAAYRNEFLPTYEDDDRPFVIGHPASLLTQVPARDGLAHGGIKRSNKFPNCSYFKNWTSVDDKVTWTARVATSGTYRVTLYYAAKSAGTQYELRFNDSTLPFSIDESHDVPETGAENDRDPRKNSYIKDFKPIDIGEINLAAGDGELTLQATKIVGAEAMEMRLLLLERIEE